MMARVIRGTRFEFVVHDVVEEGAVTELAEGWNLLSQFLEETTEDHFFCCLIWLLIHLLPDGREQGAVVPAKPAKP